MKFRITVLLTSLFSFLTFTTSATEGMWIPTLLEAVEDEMQAMGLELTAEDIYSINNSSLKDAIVHFNGGCTAELISSQGLLLTNHHCGYSQIQSHSSLENNYLRDGFWAKDLGSELPNENLSATLIDKITDVTDQMFNGVTSSMTDEEVQQKLQENAQNIEQAAKTDLLTGSVRAYNYGNSYFLITTITYKDVRLVGTPPDAVGKFGGDTDNWVWPRHTGDFSIFRIYADGNNNPAEYSADNKPYEPRQHLKVSLNGVEEGDFTMVFGFPGRTEQYLISDAVQYVMETANPMRINMRDQSLAIIDAAMRADEKTKIQYASKQSSISNAWKKWKGQNRGLRRLDALTKKLDLEAGYQEKANAQSDARFKTVIPELSALYQKNLALEKAKDLYVEYYYYGPEIIDFSNKLVSFSDSYLASESDEEKKELKDRYTKMVNNYFDDYDVAVDKDIFRALTPLYSEYLDDNFEPIVLAQGKGNWDAFTAGVFKNKVATQRDAALSFINGISKGKAKKFKKSLAAKVGIQVDGVFRSKALPEYRSNSAAINAKMKTFVEGMMLFFPEKDYWADANSTLRLTFGKAEGSEPVDGTIYKFYTTADGILDKNAKGIKDYELPEDLVALLKKEEYGVYAHSDGELRVCFTGSNHTTGGNSGSPALDSKGHLIGLNFDRSWESTMSDIMFDPEQCRNIMVDIRYVLFIIDKYAGATRLIDEMDLIKGEEEKADTEVLEEKIPMDKLDFSNLDRPDRQAYVPSCEDNNDYEAEHVCSDKALIQMILGRVEYPAEAKNNNIQGRILLELMVDENGTIRDTRVIKGAHDLLTNEALRAVSLLPDFVPAQLNGKNIRSAIVVPVLFKL